MSKFSVVLKGGLPWGFRLQGGEESGNPITISKINPNSKAYNEGVQVGDYLETVNGHPTQNLNIGDTQQIIKNSKDELLLELRRSEPTTNGVLNGHVHHHNSLNSQHQPQQQQQQLQNHINSGAGLRPAFTSNNMDSYHKTPYSSTSGWSQYGADAVFSHSPPTIPKYKQSISLPMSPTSSERSFSLQRQPLSPGSHQNPAMSGSYERATRPLEIKVDHPGQQFSQPPQPGQMAVPYYTPSRHVGRPVPQKDSHERNVPITVLSPQQNRNRSYSESDPYGFNIGQVLEPGHQPWRAGPSEPPKPNYGSGSYATLPVKRAAKQQPVVKKASDTNAIQQHNDQRYDFNMYSTLPTIKPLKSTQKIDTSDTYNQNQSFDYSQPLWTNQETPRVSSSFPKSQQGAFGDSTPSASSTLTSSDSHDTIVSGTSSKDFRKPINVIHEESKPIKVVHEERAPSKPIKYTYQDFMKPQRAVREDFKQEPQEEFIKPQKVVREESKPRARQPVQMPSDPAEVLEEMIVPQKKEDVQMFKRAPDFGSLPKTKSPNQKKDIGTFHTLPSKSSTSPSAKPTVPVVNGNVTSHHTLGPLSPTSSSKPGVWSPGIKPATFVKAEPEVSPRPVQPEPLFNVKPVWTPGGSPSGARKEFKPVRLNTNVSYKPVEKPKPKPKVISPSVKPEDSFSWQPPDSPSSREPTKLPASTVQYQLASSKLESLLPEAIENAPPMNGLDTSFDSTKDELHLPQTQSPYITLLQKSREGQFPKGAKYIGKIEKVDGDQKHTDTYYTTKTVEEEASSKVVEQKPKIFDGIGPVDQEGVPLAFRKNIDEKNQHAWYRQMYKNLHKTEKKDELLGINDIIDSIFEDAVKNIEDNNYTPTYKFPEEISDTRSEEAKIKETTNNEVNSKVNPYRPSYEIPSRFIDDSGYRSEPEGKSKNLFKNRSKSTSSDESRRLYNYPPPNVQSKIEVYRNQPRSIMEYEPGFSSLAFQEAKTVHNPPADKPGQFSNYTVGGQKEEIKLEEPADKESYKRVQLGGEIPIHGLQKPAPPKPKKWTPTHLKQDDQSQSGSPHAQNTNMSNVDPQNDRNLIRHVPVTTSNSLPISPRSDITNSPSGSQQSPTIKTSKLRMPRSSLTAAEQLGVKSPPVVNTNENGAFKHQTSDVKRLVPMSEKEKRRKDEERLYRKQRLEQLYEEERRRKVLQEEQNNESRRHNDFFMPSMKSPIPNDRFNDTNGMLGVQTLSPNSMPSNQSGGMASLSVPTDRRRGFKIQGKAKGLYNFSAQNPRELPFRKGDIIYLLRQIDKNWFEGERYGRVGIFPVNYVEVMTSIEAAQAAAVQAEGQGRVKYNFTAQSPVELSLRKGEYVTLLRSVDDNWFEGRSGNKQGIFPSAYIEIINEPSTPLITPAPSVICTPMTGRGTPEMLSPSGYDAPTPPPQPSPSAFNQPRFPPSQQFNYRQQPQQQQSPSALRSQSNPLSPVINQELEQRVFSQKSQLSPTHGKKQVTINTSAYQDQKPSPSKGYGVKSKVADDDLAINRYRAVYAYKPQNEDELELQEGDEVYVMEKCDDGWFVGTSGRSGNFGTFPGNYVQLI